MSQLYWQAAILLANSKFFEGVKHQFSPSRRRFDSDQFVMILSILGLAIFGFWLLSKLLAIQESRRSYTSPRRLFLELCRGHGLAWGQIWSLWRAARCQRLDDPARIFVDPDCFNRELLGPVLFNAVEPIRRKIFGNLNALQAESDDPEHADNRPTEEAAGAPSELDEVEADTARVPLFPSPDPPSLDVPPWSNQNQGHQGAFPLSLLGNVPQEER